MTLVDLSHPIEHGMITYPGLPAPVIDDYLSYDDSAGHYAPGTEFTIGRITMVANTGTYLDTPKHRYRDGHDLSELPLDRCALLPAVVVDGGSGPIGAGGFADLVLDGTAVLLRTGWDRHWGSGALRRPGASASQRGRGSVSRPLRAVWSASIR